MPKTIVETINARIDKILADRAAELTEAENALAEAKAAADEARGRADDAVSATDVAGYDAACLALDKATRAAEVYEKRLEQLRSKRNVSAAEDATVMAQIRTYQKALQDDATAEIVALLSRIEDLGRKYYDDQNAANELIWRWHSQVCPQSHPRAVGLDVCRSDLQINDTDLRGAIKNIATGYFYRQQVGADDYHGFGSIWTR